MVARKTSAEAQGDNPAKQAFDAWRRTLGHVAEAAVRSADVAADDLLALRRGSPGPLKRKELLAVGLVCLLAGAVWRATFPVGPVTPETLILGAGVIGWALVRRFTLGLVARNVADDASTLNAALGLGLLPIAASANGLSAAVGWVLSGVATGFALGLFMNRRRAYRLVAAAWLIQLGLLGAVVALYYVAIYLLVALFV